MPCDTRLKPRQTIQERITEVREGATRAGFLLTARKIKAVVDKKTGAVAFQGLSDKDRDGMTDACIYRRIMATGTSLAKAELARAEQMAGRPINKQAVAQGIHSHDGGESWHNGH